MWFFRSSSPVYSKYDKLVAELQTLKEQVGMLHRLINQHHQELIEVLNHINQPVICCPHPPSPIPLSQLREEQSVFMNELRIKIEQIRQGMGDSHGF